MKKLFFIIKKILKKIWIFFKLLILSIISLGGKENKEKKNINPKKEERKEEKPVINSNPESAFVTPKTLIKKENQKSKKEFLKEERKKEAMSFEDEKILEAVKKVLKKKEQVLEEQEIKEKLIPKIKKVIAKKEIHEEEKWQAEIKKEVEKYFEEKQKKIQEKEELKKETAIQKEAFIKETTTQREEFIKEDEEKEMIKMSVSKRKEKLPTFSNKNSNPIIGTEKEEVLIDDFKDYEFQKIEETPNEIEKLQYPEKIFDEKNILEEISNPEETKEPIIIPITKEIRKEPLEEKIIHFQKEELQTLKNEIEESRNTEKKEPEKAQILEDVTPILKNLEREVEISLQKATNELQKETLEEKDNFTVEIKLDYLLNQIEETKIKYKDVLTTTQIEKLNQEGNKLRKAKSSLKYQLDDFIQEENKILEQIIPNETKNNLQKELEKMHLENNIEINEILLGNIESLNNKTQQEIARIEKYLIKSKLKKASKSLEIPFLLSLPFVRNKYFFYFTAGLFASNHLNFLKSIFRRKKVEYTPMDFSNLKKGQDALIGAMGMTLNNIEALESLEKEILTKYPELINDPEFLVSLTDLKGKLYSNYNALAKKQETIMRYNFQSKKYMRKRKRNQY